ncbi:MAG: iron complex outerrane recepter protein [Burkholderiales bacterium]
MPVALRYRFADVAPSSFRNTTETSRLLLGAKGSRYGWDWESAFSYNRIDLQWRNRGFLYFPALVNAINTQAYRPFGNNSPQTIAAISPGISAL